MPGHKYNGTLFLGPNAQLYAQYGGQEKYLAAKKALDNAKKKYTNQEAKLREANASLDAALNTPGYGLYAKLNDAKQANNTALISSLKLEISNTKAKQNDNLKQISLILAMVLETQTAFENKKVKDNNSSGSGADSTTQPHAGKGPWYFNAPLVNSSYFLNKGELPKMLPAGSSSVGDALKFWTSKENAGGKGTIQMDRKTNTVELKANARKTSPNPKTFDDRMYGFRFQYNPTTINMTWAGMMGANPVYEAAGLDPAVPMSANLFTGTISFDIILNRIQDIALINNDGTFKNNIANPYPWKIETDDLKTIVQKGTMYDLEYLFRTMHGYAFYTNFNTTLMGKTNDPGWLPVRPVELHLGNKMRYRVRVSGLEVVHKIFSEKMVPLLSVVTFTCNRYWDGDTPKDPKKK